MGDMADHSSRGAESHQGRRSGAYPARRGLAWKPIVSRLTAFLHRTLWLAYAALAAMGIGFVTLLMDRAPPFRILPMQPVVVHAGEWAFIEAPVWRDPGRKCSATFSRFLFDADGARFDLVGQQLATVATIERMERDTPGRLLIKVQMPPLKDADHPHGMAAGPALLLTSLSYVCNRAQRVWPLEVETEIPLWVVQ